MNKHPVIREPAKAPAKIELPKIRGSLEPLTEVKLVDASKVAARTKKPTAENPES